MKILITGNAGFVGKEFMKQLDGHEITGIDIVNGIDARDFFAKDDTQFDLVVHLAAIVGGRATIEGQPLKVATDLAIDSDMFQWALRTKPKRVIYYSSSAAYPIHLQGYGSTHKLQESDINLDDVRLPDYTYGWAKLTGEILAKYAQEAGLRVHVFRPFSGYGETQDMTYPFPSFIQRAVNKENPFQIWGTGNQVRDFIHISDVVSGTLEAVKNDIQGPVNLGIGRPISFIEFAEVVSSITGYEPDIQTDSSAPEGVAYRVCDSTKFLSFYQPKVSFEDGIERAIKFKIENSI